MRPSISILSSIMLAVACSTVTTAQDDNPPKTLDGTSPLVVDRELSDRILDGAHRFLDAKIAAAPPQRESRWTEIMRLPPEEREQEFNRLRERLREITGAIDPRVTKVVPQIVAPLDQPAKLAAAAGLSVQEIRWPVIAGYEAAGLVIDQDAVGVDAPARTTVIVLPDADTPVDQLVGLRPSTLPSAGMPLQLAALGCRVIIPYPITRHQESRSGRVVLTDREYVYRATFVLGRHPLGLEMQSVLALVDWIRAAESAGATVEGPSVVLMGHGEGGLVAMLAAALDTRIDLVMISGAFGNRDSMWSEPIARNVFGLLSDFGDAQLACLIAPRTLIIEPATVPDFTVTAAGAAPGTLVAPSVEQILHEVRTIRQITGNDCPWLRVVEGDGGLVEFASPEGMRMLIDSLPDTAETIPDQVNLGKQFASATAHQPAQERGAIVSQFENLSDTWIRTSRTERDQWTGQLDTSSLAAYEASILPHRERFERDVIGRFEDPLAEPATRTRVWKQTPHWTGWQMEMDVFPDVVAGGILLVPEGALTGPPRPVVVCVHGLEGTPTDTIEGDHYAYHDFADHLCRRGYVVFCPQQLYLGHDRFRLLQRKANAIGKTLFSIMIPQHRQIIRALREFDFVDPQRIAFYGLSYGGKSAMRIPSVVTEYNLSICSADYNEWVLKNSSTRDPFSYVWTPEYEIFEFNLARTFNYAEMAALICPRPFMVERGHHDGVGIDRWVAFEYAPVRFLYAARLGIPERTEIEFFDGPHTIHGQGTFEFLDKHLNGPPQAAD